MRGVADGSEAQRRPLTLILSPGGEENPRSFNGAKAR